MITIRLSHAALVVERAIAARDAARARLQDAEAEIQSAMAVWTAVTCGGDDALADDDRSEEYDL